MDQEKLIKLQLQMKQNNSDYKDFLDGIESWSDEMKDKGKNTTNETIINSFPIRNSAVKVKKCKKKKIQAYDYDAWDKFDVDKALDEEEESEVDEQSEERMERLVKEHREVGNIRFKEGNYSEATAEYTRAILCDGTNAVLYSNRAASLLKLGSHEAAEVDCCRAIELDSTSVKAYYRRGQCRILLSKKEEALDDFRAILRLDPLNKAAEKEVVQLEKELNVRGVVLPIFGGPLKGFESSKPLMRVTVADVDPERRLNEVVKDAPPPQSSIISDELAPFSVPLTVGQLSKHLTKYRRNELLLAKYVSAIDPTTYRRLLGQSLDSKLLQDFVDGLSFSLNSGIISNEKFVTSINCLAEVARFSSLWLMMSVDDKRGFSQALASLNQQLSTMLNVAFST